MWAERPNDQADGLRRMFSPERLRVVHIVAGGRGVGRTTVAVHLGAAFAKMGRETLLMDLSGGRDQGKALGRLGLTVPGSVRAPELPIATGPHGLKLLALDCASERGRMDAARIGGCCARLAIALITDRAADAAAWLPIELQQREFIVVLSRAAASITAGYALIKRLSANGACRRFHVLINRAGSREEAQLIFRNIARAARGYLDVELGMLGFVPADPALALAAREQRSVLESRPEAPAAAAFTRLAYAVAAWPQPAAESACRDFARAATAA